MNIEKYNPTGRFSDRAKLYSQARPDYPGSALDFIEAQLHGGGGEVLDIGAGTGISSRALAAKGFRVTALEPNEEMLQEAREHPAYREKIEFVKARAEQTGLSSDTFDGILCAQAFHWFDPDLALIEFCRLLKSAGWLFLMWNERDEKDEFTKRYGDLLRTLPDTSRVELKRGEAADPLMVSSLFHNQFKKSFEHEQVLDLSGFLGRAFSSSYVPHIDSDEGKSFAKQLEDLFAFFQVNGSIVLKYECSVYCGQK